MATIADYFKDLIDDASDSIQRIAEEGERLREIKAKAGFGLRVLGHALKSELDHGLERMIDRATDIAKGR